jgi:hypothetical protein
MGEVMIKLISSCSLHSVQMLLRRIMGARTIERKERMFKISISM